MVVCSLVLVSGGTLLAFWVTTDGTAVDVESTSFETETGISMAATVYEPATTTTDDTPAVLLIHGYTGERGTMSSFATELAARGYVAVAVDQPGHGASDPPAFADGWGGPAALSFTRGLDAVDPERVAMVGHSMGGFASLAAAERHPEAYESIVLVGSTWGEVQTIEGIPDANTTFPRNMAVVFSIYDEFSVGMYDERIPGAVHRTEKVAAAFGTDPPVEHGRIYGSIEDGTARQFTAPRHIHTGMHRSPATVRDTLSWIDLTIGERSGGTSGLTDQRWYWATFGHVFAFVGALGLLVSGTVIGWRRFGRDRSGTAETGTTEDGDPVADTSSTDHVWTRRTALVSTAIPALAFYPLYGLGAVAVPVTRVTHQELTHGYLVWALGSLALVAGYLRWRGDPVHWPHPARATIRRATLAAVFGMSILGLVIVALSAVPGAGFRAWLVGLGQLTPVRLISALVYGPPLVVAGIILSYGTAGRIRDHSPGRCLGRAIAVTGGGLALFLAVQYVWLFLGFGLPVGVLGPVASVALRTLFGVTVVTAVAAWTTQYTDSPLPGGIVAGLLATWLLVATGPIHVAVL